jgi:hypothetical protein
MYLKRLAFARAFALKQDLEAPICVSVEPKG